MKLQLWQQRRFSCYETSILATVEIQVCNEILVLVIVEVHLCDKTNILARVEVHLCNETHLGNSGGSLLTTILVTVEVQNFDETLDMLKSEALLCVMKPLWQQWGFSSMMKHGSGNPSIWDITRPLMKAYRLHIFCWHCWLSSYLIPFLFWVQKKKANLLRSPTHPVGGSVRQFIVCRSFCVCQMLLIILFSWYLITL